MKRTCAVASMCRPALALLLTAIGAAVPHAGMAQAFPVKPLRLVVAYAAGGGPDLVARLVAQYLAPVWGQQIVVDNRAGAGGILGAELVARAAPDGYTWGMVSSSFVMTGALHKNLPYSPVRDFAPVTTVAFYPVILVVHASVKASNVQELIALARRQPDLLHYASAGNGTPSHLAGELFKMSTGVSMVHVPYRSAGYAVTDLLGGHVNVMFATLPSVLGHVHNGELRALAIGGVRRVAELPNVPTVVESGVPGYEASGWAGVLAPAKTPPATIALINKAIGDVLKNPDVQRRFAAQGATAAGSTPAEFAALIRDDIVKWGRVVRESGITAD